MILKHNGILIASKVKKKFNVNLDEIFKISKLLDEINNQKGLKDFF